MGDELNKLMENKLAVVAVVVLAGILLLFLASSVIMDKVADKVIEKLRQEYTPGPYVPGFDPDKVNPNFWRQQQPDYAPPRRAGSWDSDWETERLR